MDTDGYTDGSLRWAGLAVRLRPKLVDANSPPSSSPRLAIPRRVPGRVFWLGLLLGLTTLAVFWPAAHLDFSGYDDPAYVTENTHVQSGLTWGGIVWAFRTGHASNWHPLTWLSHMLDGELFGRKAGPQHLVNLCFHIANALLLFLLLRRLTGALWRSVLVAALFALHPLHVESVAWIAERKDVLSGFFFMLTLWAYARNAECGVRNAESRNTQHASRITFHASRFYFLSLLFFACGLMSKPMLVTLPFVLLLLDYWPLRRFELKALDSRLKTEDSRAAPPSLHHSSTPPLHPSITPLLLEKLPFFALAATSCVITVMVQRKGGSVSANLSVRARIANALVSYLRYIGKMFWPRDLSVLYPHPGHWPLWLAFASAALLLAVLFMAMLFARRRPYLLVGWLWYCGMLVPVAGIVQVGTQSMADRYTYLPLIGLFIMLVWGGYDVAAHWRHRSGLLSALSLAMLCICIGFTRRQFDFWKDNVSLWQHAVDVTKRNAIAEHNLGVALAVSGDVGRALQHFAVAAQLRPERAEFRRELAQALAMKQRFPEAAHQYEESLRLHPGDAGVHNDLANALARTGRTEDAIAHYKEALRLGADNVETRFNLGLALAARGSYREAGAQFQEVLRLKPDDSNARRKLDQALLAQARCEEVIAQCRDVLRSQPTSAKAHTNLGDALVQAGQFAEGLAQYAEAARLEPVNAEVQYHFGVALLRKGDYESAAARLDLALQLDPNFAPAHYALGQLAMFQRHLPEALEHWRNAVRLNSGWADPLDRLARVLATSAEPELRDGPEAVKLASRAAELSGNRNARILDTLAAAYAESGRFTEASAAARQAQSLAAAQGQRELAEQIQRHLALYDAHQPYREDPTSH